jgi:hypothetical protein
MSPAHHRYRFPSVASSSLCSLCLCGESAPSSVRNHRFSKPFVPSTYKSLFPQLFCFLIYTKPPGVEPHFTFKGNQTMIQQFAKSSSINDSARCNYRYANGMRCRLLGFGSQPFCPKHTHSAVPPPPNSAEIASTLTANLDDFTSAAQINDFLARLLLLLAQDKISTRRAAVLAYITNQLLRTLPAIAKEENAEPTTFIFDAPRPERALPAPDQNPPRHTGEPEHQIVPA